MNNLEIKKIYLWLFNKIPIMYSSTDTFHIWHKYLKKYK